MTRFLATGPDGQDDFTDTGIAKMDSDTFLGVGVCYSWALGLPDG